MHGRTERTAEKETAFLDHLSTTANVTAACLAVHIGRTTAYEWRAGDPEFARRWDAAVELGTEALEDEAVRRASAGTLKPVFYQGRECGHVREYSDLLLIFMLKARRPEKYRERHEIDLRGTAAGASDADLLAIARAGGGAAAPSTGGEG